MSTMQESVPAVKARFATREVDVGGIPLGGNHPLRLQSMTNTDTCDVKATIEQSKRVFDAGADYVRISVPAAAAVDAFHRIKKGLEEEGYRNPLVADIHYNADLAVRVAPFSAKVRINPGNYTDRRLKEGPGAYERELDNIRKKITPLVEACREYGTAIRIGTNFGSLSPRIVHRYGNTPLAMVKSTMEFLEVLESLGFYNNILSLKASNPLVMIQAYRMMVQQMTEGRMAYPLHLGVTEAGEGLQGRIKSATGIASLLKDGIGDTIRVSLSEDPEKEIPFAAKIAGQFSDLYRKGAVNGRFSLSEFSFREDAPALPLPHKAIVIAGGEPEGKDNAAEGSSLSADLVATAGNEGKANNADKHGQPSLLYRAEVDKDEQGSFPYLKAGQLEDDSSGKCDDYKFIELTGLPETNLEARLKNAQGLVLVPLISKGFKTEDLEKLHSRFGSFSIIPRKRYETDDREVFIAEVAADFSSLLLQRKIQGLWLEAEPAPGIDITETAFGFLQAAGLRITSTEFISCPTCSRTSFDLQGVAGQLKQKLKNLPGIKIAIMGCVVNGPGEMADADYGILGTATGKVHIYKGSKPLIKNIEPAKAAEKLLEVLYSEGFMNKQ